MSWTEKRIELLKKLVADGGSAQQIAAEIGGISRNAVIGKVNRLGLHLRGSRIWHPGGGESRPVRISVPRQRKRTAASPEQLRHASQHYLEALAASTDAPPETPTVTFEQLDRPHCRWPIGDPGTETFGFCGAKRHGEQSYCAHHCSIAYQGLPVRRSEAETAEAHERMRRMRMAKKEKKAA